MCVGFDSLGSVAGEVVGGARSLGVAFSLSVPIIVSNYALPVLISYAILPDMNQWHDGSFSEIAKQVSPILG